MARELLEARAYLAATKPPLADVTAWPKRRINIPHTDKSAARIVGFIIEPGDEAYGELGLSEPLAWLDRMCAASPPMPGRGEGFDAEALRVAREVISDMVRYGIISNEVGTTAYYVGDNVLPIIMGRPLAASPPKEDTHAK
jgi:hypothetical protein